jgi:hypothetical protein
MAYKSLTSIKLLFCLMLFLGKYNPFIIFQHQNPLQLWNTLLSVLLPA